MEIVNEKKTKNKYEITYDSLSDSVINFILGSNFLFDKDIVIRINTFINFMNFCNFFDETTFFLIENSTLTLKTHSYGNKRIILEGVIEQDEITYNTVGITVKNRFSYTYKFNNSWSISSIIYAKNKYEIIENGTIKYLPVREDLVDKLHIHVSKSSTIVENPQMKTRELKNILNVFVRDRYDEFDVYYSIFINDTSNTPLKVASDSLFGMLLPINLRTSNDINVFEATPEEIIKFLFKSNIFSKFSLIEKVSVMAHRIQVDEISSKEFDVYRTFTIKERYSEFAKSKLTATPPQKNITIIPQQKLPQQEKSIMSQMA